MGLKMGRERRWRCPVRKGDPLWTSSESQPRGPEGPDPIPVPGSGTVAVFILLRPYSLSTTLGL